MAEQDDTGKAKQNMLSEQAALILSYEEIIKKINEIRSGSFEDRLFKNFSTIRYKDKATPTGHFFITNNLTKKPSMKSFFQTIPTSILSFLNPSIKMYKTFFINEKPLDWRIPFDDSAVAYGNQTSEFVAQDPDLILRGNGSLPAVGIKSFSYEYKGVNPAEINTNIHATMEIYFQNPQWLVNKITIAADDERFVNAGTSANQTNPSFEFSYSDLINQVTRTIRTNGEDKPNEKYYRIKIESGYADIPPNILNELLNSATAPNGSPYTDEQKEDIKDAIKSTKVILFLTPYSYDLNFNEDGTVVLKINFQAAMDTLLSSNKSDLFLLTEEAQKLDENASLIEDYLQVINKKPKSPEESIVGKEEENCAIDEKMAQSIIDEFKAKFPDLASQTPEELIISLRDLRITAYNSIYDAFVGGVYQPLIEKDSDPPNASYPYIWNAAIDSQLYKPTFFDKKTNAAEERAARYIENTPKIQNLVQISNKNKQPLFSDADKTKYLGLSDKQFDEAVADRIKRLANTANIKAVSSTLGKVETGGYNSTRQQNANIKFIFLGDLLNIAFETLLWIRPIQERPRIYLGSIPIAIPKLLARNENDKKLTFDKENPIYIYPNLADIPISMNLFENFILTNIIEKKRTKYPVLEFVKDIISQLIIPAISPSMLGDQAAVAGAIRMSTNFLTVNAEDNKDILSGKELKDDRYNPIFNEESNKKLKDYNSKKDNYELFNPINYFFITCTSQFPKNQVTGLEEDDEKNNLLHFRMGTEYGIIKRLSFQKVDIQYQREFIARREGQGKGTSIKQFYNSNVEMFGNNIFRPGDYIYIHPNYMYSQINKEGLSPSIVQTIDLEDSLGVGGYYLVTNVNTNFSPGQYSTSIKCSYQATRKKDQNGKITVESANNNCAK